jgi:tight adherence protein C
MTITYILSYGFPAIVFAIVLIALLAKKGAKDNENEKAPDDTKGRQKVSLKGRLKQAGIYSKNAELVFGLMRLLLLATIIIPSAFAGFTGLVPMKHAIIIGVILGIISTMAPSFWLDRQKKGRQSKVRRSLPDAMDLLNVCMAGGLSLPASIARVGRELKTAHPLLSMEIAIVEKENLMGTPTGVAMRGFADRFDLEELRSLSGVISQTEKFGGSVTKALVIYSETMRTKRFQMAETKAQKASILIMLPTLLCIFPGIFIVILGPAAIQVLKMFSEMGL